MFKVFEVGQVILFKPIKNIVDIAKSREEKEGEEKNINPNYFDWGYSSTLRLYGL